MPGSRDTLILSLNPLPGLLNHVISRLSGPLFPLTDYGAAFH